MITLLGQVSPEAAAKASERLSESVLGCVVLLMLLTMVLLEKRRDTREGTREDARDKREAARELSRNTEVEKLVNAITGHNEKIDDQVSTLVGKMNDMMSVNLTEVLSRPQVAQAARAEMEQIERRLRR